MESYNRRFGERMGVHPGLLRFVADLEVEAKAEWREAEDARNGVSEHRTQRGEVEWPEIPPDFDDYVRMEMEAVEREEEEEKRRKTRGGERKILSPNLLL